VPWREACADDDDADSRAPLTDDGDGALWFLPPNGGAFCEPLCLQFDARKMPPQRNAAPSAPLPPVAGPLLQTCAARPTARARTDAASRYRACDSFLD
jgi:hypothetical protein